MWAGASLQPCTKAGQGGQDGPSYLPVKLSVSIPGLSRQMSHPVPQHIPLAPSSLAGRAAPAQLLINISPSSLQKQMKVEGNLAPLLSPLLPLPKPILPT